MPILPDSAKQLVERSEKTQPTQKDGPRRPTRVMCVIAGMQAGGAERVMALLCNHLARKGYDVNLLTLTSAPEAAFYKISSAIHYRTLKLAKAGRRFSPNFRLGRVVARIAALRQNISTLSPDVVISFVDITNITVLLATRGLKIPVIISERIDPAAYSHRLSNIDRFSRQITYPFATRIVVQTSRAARFFERSSAETLIVTIPNPVPMPDATAHPELASSDGRFRIIGIGRLDHQKGFDILIDSFAKIADRFPEWDVTIFGKGPEHGALLERIMRLKLGGRIKLAGLSADITDEIQRSHLMAFPSRYEGFPNALAEAMAGGLPSVAFDRVSGVEDLIVSGESGILVRSDPADSAHDLFSQALAQFMSAPALRARMGKEARARVANFQPDLILEKWEHVIATSLDNR